MMLNCSIKAKFLFTLLKELFATKHRVLIFSLSKVMLNIIEEIMKTDAENSYKYLRIDGDTKPSTRTELCE